MTQSIQQDWIWKKVGWLIMMVAIVTDNRAVAQNSTIKVHGWIKNRKL